VNALVLFVDINELNINFSFYCLLGCERIHLIKPIKVVIVSSSNNGGISYSDWYNLQEAYNNGYNNGYNSGYQNGSNSNQEEQSWWSSWGKCASGIIGGAFTHGLAGCGVLGAVGGTVGAGSGFVGGGVGAVPGAASGAAIGCVAGGVIGAVGGAFSGAADSCD